MFKWRLLLSSLVVISLFSSQVSGLDRSELFPYGENADDQTLNSADNVSSGEIKLAVPLLLYDVKYPSVWVNNDGILTFIQEVPEFFNGPFPLNYPAIAPFYADIDLSRGGSIFFRESTQLDLLNRIDRDISANFPDINFASRSLFIVTFDSVSYYKVPVDSNSTPGSQGSSNSVSSASNTINGITNGNNTFQLLIASNGEVSFVQILYPANGIQWIRGEGKVRTLPDAKAQAGFIGSAGQLKTLRGSGTDQMFNLDRTSNLATPTPGYWMFGLINGPVKEPVAASVTGRETCSRTNNPCIPTANCQDKEQGICCACKDGYVGNGISCFPIDTNPRINGKVTGKVNDLLLTYANSQVNQDSSVILYSLSEDGRSYTALSTIANDIADLQSLLPINDIVGWLFAKTSPGTSNGFMLTGGTFNRTVDIEFTQTGDRATINERFLGPDVFNNLKVTIDINGSLRKILPGSKLELTEFIYDYKVHNSREKVVLKSKSARKYKLENGLEVPFNIDQTITYNQCPFRTLDEAPRPFRLETTKNFVIFDSLSNNTVIRLSGNYKILPALNDDPCTKSHLLCGKHSSCVVDNDNARCICDRGFSGKYSPENTGQVTCEDIDECRQNNRCHVNADCINTHGSYHCRCKLGFAGTGFFCQQQLSCNEVHCDANASCSMNNSTPECKCNSGFYGNGYYCTPSDDGNQPDCRSPETSCPPDSSCLPVEDGSKHKCICNSGYIGDGYSCRLSEPDSTCTTPCGRNALCSHDEVSNTHQCRCLPGFVGNGFNCIRSSQLISCANDSECHNRARCQVSQDSQSRYCFCNEGLYGDGKYCGRSEIDSTQLDCKVNKVCSDDATCLYNSEEERYFCRCVEGFVGDGVVCEPLRSCKNDSDCPLHGKCNVNVNNRGHCECSSGYNRTETEDGLSFTCQPLPDAPCNLVANCHEKAECVYQHSMRRYECRCKRGYKGDGFSCDKTIVPCNILNTCDVHGQCKYNLDERRHACQCLPGWEGDGHSCIPNLPCNERPEQCHQYAECVYSAQTERHSCECRKGYIGDGLTCQIMPSYDGDYLIFSQGMSLLRLPLTPAEENPGQLLITRSHSTPVSLDVDCAKGHIYWSDVSSRKIYRAPYNGSSVEAVTDQLEGSPEGIAVDWVGRYIFWTDSSRDAIFVAPLDATNSTKKLIYDGLRDPRDIAVHPGIGKIYWTDWNREKPKIEFSNMDGSDRRILIEEDLGLPNMLTIDYSAHNLCWTDADLHRIECADLHGSNRRTMYAPVEYPFGITCADNLIFWTDWKPNSVDKVNRLGGQAQSLALPPGGNGRVYDIVTVPKKCPHMSNACQINNGGCEEKMCLPNSQSGRTCLCPDGDESCPLSA